MHTQSAVTWCSTLADTPQKPRKGSGCWRMSLRTFCNRRAGPTPARRSLRVHRAPCSAPEIRSRAYLLTSCASAPPTRLLRKSCGADSMRCRTPSSRRYARNDPMAQSLYAQRTVPPRAGAGQGRFSNPTIEGPLTQDLVNARAQGPPRKAASPVTPGIETEGGTMGSARTDIPGLEKRAFIGKSPQAGGAVNPNSNFPPATNPEALPHTHAHAEQHIADQLEAALKSVPREQLKGRTVWILIEQEPCSTCAQAHGQHQCRCRCSEKALGCVPGAEIRDQESQHLGTYRVRGARGADRRCQTRTSAGAEACSRQ